METLDENMIFNFIKGLSDEEKTTYFKIINKLERRLIKNGSIEVVFKKGRKAFNDVERENARVIRNAIQRDKARLIVKEKKLLK